MIDTLEAAWADVAIDAPDGELVRRAAALREQAADLERLTRRAALAPTAPHARLRAG